MALKKLSSGVTVMVYREGSQHETNDDIIHIRFSDDDGLTWSDVDKTIAGAAVTGFPAYPTGSSYPTDGLGPGEPWLYIAPNGNLIMHTWLVNYGTQNLGTWQTVSADGGATWGAWAQVDFTGILDSDNHIFSTDDDFVYNGVIYAAARVYTSDAETTAKEIFIKSEDNGASWAYVSDICSNTDNAHECGLEYLGDGNIFAVLRSVGNINTYKTTSSNMGATWAAVTNVNATIGLSGRHRIYTDAHLKGEANWWTDTTLIMCGFLNTVQGSSQGRINSIWVSRDSGVTWSRSSLDGGYEDGGYGDLVYDAANDDYLYITNRGTLGTSSVVVYRFKLR